MNKNLTGLLAGFVCYGLSASVAHAININEDSPDAGELVGTAQNTLGLGQIESISGTLINLGTDAEPIDDIDLYKILITDPAAFSVTVAADLSIDNDAMLHLFDATGVQVLVNDDGGLGDLPQFNPGDLIDPPNHPGMYFLAFSLFLTEPEDVVSVPPTLRDGWYRDPIPRGQTGPYTLSLTGVGVGKPPPTVPEPGMLALFGLGLVGMGVARRRMKV